MQKGNVYLVDCGILLPPTDPEFSAYNMVYDHKYGYYDCGDGQYYSDASLEELKQIGLYTVTNLSPEDDTYFIIQPTFLPDYVLEDGDFDGVGDIPVEDETYNVKDIVWSIARINGKIIENFV